MTHAGWLLWAEGPIRTTFEWGRIQSNADWILPIGGCLAILLFVRYLYRRDAVELHPVLGWFLTALRTATFLGLLVLYLQPQWRAEREEVRNSRVLLLADTSLSMGLSDGQPASSVGGLTREQQVVKALKESDFLARLRKTHDVVVFPFAEGLKPDRVVSLGKLEPTVSDGDNEAEGRPHPNPLPEGEGMPDWDKLLAPTGTETRLGQALRQVIQEERGTPVSGVVVLSDGGQNAGVSPDAAVELAQEAKIPVFTVGLGSDRQPTSVAVSDLVVPARAYPGDHYSVTGYVRAQGMAGKTVTVEVLSRPAGEAADAARQGTGQVIESRQITLGGDGEVLPVKFESVPEEPGRRTLCFRIQSPQADRSPADQLREADIEIVDRKNRVLLLAGGPTREYQFLRSLLFRDRSTSVDVLLQTGKPGLSQEARKILDDFPATREEMYDYDCVVAFDPDWQALGAAQVGLLEKWVSEQGGGLVVIAGPVYAGKGVGGWTQSSAMTAIRNLYPVEFFGRLAAMDENTYSGREPWPLDMSREGRETDFLWLGDTATASRQAWGGFPGVYSYCPLRGPKPGATVYARLTDPATGPGGAQPVYFAGQFYGSGSVFYLGSGEMWRLRSVDPAYFDQFYTKLTRHVSQGRLLRGSSRGVLLVGQDHYLLGNTVEVRAQLSNARLDPLDAPSVGLQVIQPNGAAETVVMRADPSRAGAYFGQFPVLQEGTYRLELSVPESDNERIGRRIQVKAPDLERENPRRNDALLSAIAKNTGGRYYVGMAAALDTGGPAPLVVQLKDRTSTTIVPIAPSRHHDEQWLRWMMTGLCGLLCLEWLIRRLVKLA
jgi:hypothetical protein